MKQSLVITELGLVCRFPLRFFSFAFMQSVSSEFLQLVWLINKVLNHTKP